MIFYFSGCGNSQWIAEKLSMALDDALLFIPDELKKDKEYNLKENESLGFVFPVYAWAPPQIVMRFLNQLKLSSKPSYVYFVCTCGDEAGLTQNVFSKSLKKKAWQLDAAFSVVMPETYINLPGFKLDTIENEKSKIAAAQKLLPKIINTIINRESDVFELKKGPLSFTKTYLIKPLFQSLLISDKPFKVNEDCIGCGKCMEVCPVKNIRLVDQRPLWEHHCVGCMGCYHHCPTNAIQFGKQTLGKGQYYFGKNR